MPSVTAVATDEPETAEKAAQPMTEAEAFQPVWNAPDAPHAIHTGALPLLCLYAWLAEPRAPSTLLPSSDWDSYDL